jgi:CubicO group peptidase (beta-lactamase class C family)
MRRYSWAAVPCLIVVVVACVGAGRGNDNASATPGVAAACAGAGRGGQNAAATRGAATRPKEVSTRGGAESRGDARSDGHSAGTVRRLDGSAITHADVDAAVRDAMASGKVPGLGLAIINDGAVVYEKGYGWRDVERKLAFTVDTNTYAASFTKVVFGYAALELVDRGVIALDTPIAAYLPKPLPEYDNYKDLAGDERWRKITPRMLLSHTSGLPNYRGFEDDKKLTIHFEPGTRYAYSGEGLNLLAMVIETVTKEPIETTIRRDVFEPFGMATTEMTYAARFDANHAIGYDENGKPLGPNEHMHVRAAGSMHTTVADFARFVAAVSRGERLSPKMRAEMLAPQIRITAKHEFPPFESVDTHENDAIRLSYGLTWGLYFTEPYGEAYFKEGHDDGWRNYAVCFDRSKDCVVIMTNSSNGEHIYNELLEKLQGNTFTPVEWEGFAK